MLATALIVASYVAAARVCLSLSGERARFGSLAATSVVTLAVLLVHLGTLVSGLAGAAVYLALVCVHYLVMRSCVDREGHWPWLAFLSPVAMLILIKYLHGLWDPWWARFGIRDFSGLFVGLSYLAFRLSYLAVEVRSRVVPRPGVLRYLSFAFFIPTLAVGPITTFRSFGESADRPDRRQTPIGRSLQRLLIGATKFLFLGNVVNQLSYQGLLLDGHPHPPVDLLVAAVGYYLYLYLNFSGICDMVVGGAGLIGIRVDENFDNPFAARDLQEFWNRWHITLGRYMRDLVFTPLSKTLVTWLGRRHVNHAIAVAIFIVFLLVGAWHGVGLNFLTMGLVHSVGMVVHHYYTILLKRALGRRYGAYMQSRPIRAAAVSLTFLYVSASLIFLANDFSRIEAIFQAIRWDAG